MTSWPFISLTLEMLDRKKVIPGYSFWVQLNQVSTKCLEVLKTLATVVFLCLVMLYKQGYCSLNSKFPNHLSSHNLTWDMSFIVKELSAWHRGHVCYISKMLMWNLVIYILTNLFQISIYRYNKANNGVSPHFTLGDSIKLYNTNKVINLHGINGIT